jgi:SPX domain protein involved in polyphosphate accumulation/uncharacterized membrane protein YidH (DUF202 family)
MGFHKILKKHDKRLPGAPCRAFYTSHLHAQPWVQGNYSDLLVALSAVHAALRGDAAAARRRGAGAASAAGAAGAAGAHRSVARYWVRMSDVSAIKHHLLQHLPVRQPDEVRLPIKYKTINNGAASPPGASSLLTHPDSRTLPPPLLPQQGEYMGDACLVNAVHLDNAMLELYHARLDRRPGAAAVRLAWAGDAEPDEVSVEREAVGPPGAGDGDKDGEDATGSGLNAAAAAAAAAADYGFEGEGVATPCFPLPEAAVARFLAGELPAAEAAAHWRARPGRFSDAELARMAALFADLSRAVDAKQLRPVVRTQYVSTFFQMPFDAAVRAKLDTNICMFREGAAEEDEDEDEGGSGSGSGRHAVGRGGGSMHRWRRDPALPARRAEVSRFPHAVLELRLALAPGATTPAWVAALAESGLLTEVEGFSKAAHGVAALLPEAVQAVPYWVDDETVRASMLACAPEAGSDSEGEGGSAAPRGRGAARSKPRKGAAPAGGAELEEPLLAAERRPPPPARAGPRRPSLIEWWFAKPRMAAPRARVPGVVADARPEPKTHLANERTYLSWLHMALTMGGVAGAMLGFAEGGRRDAGAASMELVALILLPVAFAMCGYALVVYTWRADAIRARTAVYYDDRRGPLALAAGVVAALGAILVLSAVDLAAGLRHQGQHVPRAPPPPPPELRFSRAF